MIFSIEFAFHSWSMEYAEAVEQTIWPVDGKLWEKIRGDLFSIYAKKTGES